MYIYIITYIYIFYILLYIYVSTYIYTVHTSKHISKKYGQSTNIVGVQLEINHGNEGVLF